MVVLTRLLGGASGDGMVWSLSCLASGLSLHSFLFTFLLYPKPRSNFNRVNTQSAFSKVRCLNLKGDTVQKKPGNLFLVADAGRYWPSEPRFHCQWKESVGRLLNASPGVEGQGDSWLLQLLGATSAEKHYPAQESIPWSCGAWALGMSRENHPSSPSHASPALLALRHFAGTEHVLKSSEITAHPQQQIESSCL